MQFTGQNLIGNTSSSSGKTTFMAVAPSTGEELETKFTEASAEEINEAVGKATSAFSVYRTTDPETRAKFLETIGEEIMALGETLIHRCIEETALPEGRLTGERMRTVNQLRLFASLIREGSWVNARIDTAIPDRSPLPKPDVRQMQKPLGPVAVFGASNFPLAFSVAGGDTASALAAGCPVIVKAHQLHPGTSEMVGRAILKAAEITHMPEGVFSLIQGASVEVGSRLVMHPGITAVGFTGSLQGGKALFDAANKRPVPIPVFAEMGSSNPVFVLPGALKSRYAQIAEGLAGSVNLGAGQFCTNPGLVITQYSEDSQIFMSAFSKAVGALAGGIMLSESMRQNYLRLTAKLADAPGVSNVGRGTASDPSVPAMVFETDAKTFRANGELADEVFGPSTLHIQVEGEEDLLTVAESLEGHLTATLHGTEEDLEANAELIHILERKVGRIIFNGYPTGVEVCHSMHHGGPYPATTTPQTTSVGTMAIYRFTKPVCYQDFPDAILPEPLQNANTGNLLRLVNGEYTRKPIV